MATRYATAYNPTDRPVVIDDEGRTLAGRTWGPVLRSAAPARSGVERGELVLVTRPKADDDVELVADATAAFDATDELNAADGPDELAEVADEVAATPTPAARKAAARQEPRK